MPFLNFLKIPLALFLIGKSPFKCLIIPQCSTFSISAQELKHELDSSYIKVKLYASLIRHMGSVLVSAQGLLFRHMDQRTSKIHV